MEDKQNDTVTSRESSHQERHGLSRPALSSREGLTKYDFFAQGQHADHSTALVIGGFPASCEHLPSRGYRTALAFRRFAICEIWILQPQRRGRGSSVGKSLASNNINTIFLIGSSTVLGPNMKIRVLDSCTRTRTSDTSKHTASLSLSL